MTVRAKSTCRWRWVTTLIAFLMFAISLFFPGSYSLGPMLLLLLYVVLLLPRSWFSYANSFKLRITAYDRWLIVVFRFYFCALAAEILWFHLNSRELNKPTRFLLAIPILLISLRYPPRVTWLWRGIFLSAVSTGMIPASNAGSNTVFGVSRTGHSGSI